MFDPTCPFRGSRALAAGLLTRAVLYGPRFRRLLPDVYVAASVPVDLTVRSRAALVLCGPAHVLAGYSAAELLGATCAPPGAPVEVVLRAPAQRRSHPSLRIRRDTLEPGDVVAVEGLAVTSPLRTAYDLGRWAPDLTEAVVAVDALARYADLRLDALRERATRCRGARSVRQLREALRLARVGAESPMETRVRLVLVGHGLPEPVLQHPVAVPGRTVYLDLAYPDRRLAVEYDGVVHRTAERARRDLVREAQLVRAGWTVLRFTAAEVLGRPAAVAERVRYELGRARAG